MGLFDNITASVSRTAKQMSDGAKELAEKNRIKNAIAGLENEIRNRFRDIGEQYYNEHRENPDAQYQEVFNALADLQVQLDAKKRELDDISGLVRCPGCGQGIPKGSKFCPACGTTAPAEQVTGQAMGAHCPVCGAAMAPGAVFCASCGNKIEAPAPAPAAQSVCPNCGASLAPDALFCAVCGTKAPGLE